MGLTQLEKEDNFFVSKSWHVEYYIFLYISLFEQNRHFFIRQVLELIAIYSQRTHLEPNLSDRCWVVLLKKKIASTNRTAIHRVTPNFLKMCLLSINKELLKRAGA